LPPQSGCCLGAHLTGGWGWSDPSVFRFSIRDGVFPASRGRCSNILSALLFLPRFQLWCCALDGGRVEACIYSLMPVSLLCSTVLPMMRTRWCIQSTSHLRSRCVVHMVVALMTKLLEPVPMSIPERVLA
jgi:hypothetical protein